VGEVLEPLTFSFSNWLAANAGESETGSVKGVPSPQGIYCPAIFGDPKQPDLRRYGHVALPSPVVPWPARPILAALIEDTEENLVELLRTDPERLVARVEAAEAAGRRMQGLSPAQLVWWSIPVIPPALRATRPEDDLKYFHDEYFTRTLNEGYRNIINRSTRLRRLLELEAPAEITCRERSMLARSVDELLANAELDEPRVKDAKDKGAPAREQRRMMDATTLFFEAFTPRLLEICERSAAAPGGEKGWLPRAARIGREQGMAEPRLVALWRLAAERPHEMHTMELEKELQYEGREPFKARV
jgi:hypothetical protein